MKILFCDHPQFDHGTFYLYEGLTRVLGAEAVIDYPFKPTYHGSPSYNLNEVRWYARAIQDGVPAGLPPFAPGETLTYDNVQQIGAAPCPGATSQEGREHDEDEIVSTMSSFDLIILGNGHRVPTIALARLKERCTRLPPIIYCDGGEIDEFNSHWVHTFRPALTFKKTLVPEVVREYKGDYTNVRVPVVPLPLPLSNPCTYLGLPAYDALQEVPVAPRAIDFVSHFGFTCPERDGLQRRAVEVALREEMIAQMSRVPTGPPYYKLLAASRIVLSMRGLGRETCRYWEIPAFGAAMLCDGTMGCVHPFPFEDGVTASFYRNLDEMEEKLVMLHRNEELRRSIAEAGRAHARKYHSVEARALFFLALVRQRVGLTFTSDQEKRLANWRTKLGWSCELPEWRGPDPVGYETDLSQGGYRQPGG